MKNQLACLTALLTGTCFLGSGHASEKQFPMGKQVQDFELKDYRGKTHRLRDLDNEIVVIAFLGTECPLVKLYGPRLVALQAKYKSQDVAFLAVNSNVQDSITEIAAFAKTHAINFPILKDLGNKVADQMGAERTPQVFALDRTRKIRYSGRIDDQYGVGYVRDEPQRHDLAAALDEMIAGKSVSTPVTVAPGCHIGRQRVPVANATVTYSNRIAHIFQQRCVECHRDGDIAPFALHEYEEVAGWAEMIEEVVREQRMPPWHADPAHGNFANNRLLSEQEKQDIYQWVRDGAPEGDSGDLPEPREFVTGWQLPHEPDAVFTIQPEPFKIEAEGEIKYQWFEVELGFDEDKWVSGVEILPGNRAVVHHILAFVRESDAVGNFGGGRGFFAGYVPGLRAKMLPPGTAKLLPAGCKLVFQLHYTPIGSEQLDQSKIGLVFADREEITHRAISTSALNSKFQIPPHENSYRVEADSRTIPWDSRILSMSPHMHLRGKSIKYEAVFPDGSAKALLDVPHYDFNWQTEYRLAQAIDLPAEARIHAVAHFDNSAENMHNPDPSATVTWGDQTWDEMMIGYFLIAIPIESPVAMPESELRTPESASEAARRRIKKFFRRIDRDGDGQIVFDEAPPILQAAFARTDTDANGEISPDEFHAGVEKYLGKKL